MKVLSRVQLFVTPWTVACQAPPSMEFSRQEYWSGLPFPSPGDLPNPGIEPVSPTLHANTLPSEPSGKPKGSETLGQLRRSMVEGKNKTGGGSVTTSVFKSSVELFQRIHLPGLFSFRYDSK